MRIAIFANGSMENPVTEAQAWIRPGDVIVAADGGTRHALRAGFTPHHIIGDLDSLSKDLSDQLTAAGSQFHISPPAKDETDLELALLWAAAQPGGIHHIVILGAFGGRPDQALANLLLLALPALKPHHVVMVSDRWTIRLIHDGEEVTIHGTVGDRLSLIPLGGTAEGITTQGLLYPLDNDVLTFGPARGVSNQLISRVANVRVQQGMVWCFHERQEGPKP